MRKNPTVKKRVKAVPGKSINIHIGQCLWKLRITKNISQKELSKKTGLTVYKIDRMEEGLDKMRLNDLFALAAFHKIKVASLFPNYPNKTKRK